MPRNSLLIAGHLTLDRRGDLEVAGGSGFYGAALAADLGVDVTLLTSVPAGYPQLEKLRDVEVVNLETDTATLFEQDYDGEDRRMRLLSRAAQLNFETVEPAAHDAFYLGPVADEISTKDVEEFTGRDCPVGLGLQGWLKENDGSGRFRPVRKPGELEVKWRENTYGFLSPSDLPGGGLSEWDRPGGIFVTYGSRGAVYRERRRTVGVPAYRVDPVDPTGAGDVYGVGTIIQLTRQPHIDPWKAGCYGAALASLAVEKQGVRFNYPESEVESRYKKLVERLDDFQTESLLSDELC